MEDSVRSLHYLMNPTNRDQLLEIASRVSKLPASGFSSWIYTNRNLYRDPDMIPESKRFSAASTSSVTSGF